MKTIKNRKFIRVHTFVWALMLILLLSSIMGTTVGAKLEKPDKPGKPPDDLEIADFKIWIGKEGAQDMSLNPPEDYLYVENEVGGYWLPPPTKGKAQREGWGVGLGPERGGYCGKYIIDKEGLTEVLTSYGADSELEAYRFHIYHALTLPYTGDVPPHRSEKADYWHIIIQWEVGILEIPNDPNPPIIIPHFLILSGNTNMDTVWEGVYNETVDTWTVTFDTAEFELHENTTEPDDPDTGSVLNKLWDGQLSFTVEIQRILP